MPISAVPAFVASNSLIILWLHRDWVWLRWSLYYMAWKHHRLKRKIKAWKILLSSHLIKYLISKITNRLEKYFDELIIDEIQDIGGRDFNFLEAIMEANINMLFVGDFYQHTFDTSRDGATNSTLFNSKAKYESRFTAKGFICDSTSLVNSWRCSKNVCQFYTTSEVYTIFGIASVNIWNPWFYSGEVLARAIGQWFRAVPVFGRAWWNCYEIVIFQWQRIILPQAPVLKIGWPCHHGQPILMTLRQTQCHQGFPGFLPELMHQSSDRCLTACESVFLNQSVIDPLCGMVLFFGTAMSILI